MRRSRHSSRLVTLRMKASESSGGDREKFCQRQSQRMERWLALLVRLAAGRLLVLPPFKERIYPQCRSVGRTVGSPGEKIGEAGKEPRAPAAAAADKKEGEIPIWLAGWHGASALLLPTFLPIAIAYSTYPRVPLLPVYHHPASLPLPVQSTGALPPARPPLAFSFHPSFHSFLAGSSPSP